jgi:Uncharacterised nucleotidyltransferase
MKTDLSMQASESIRCSRAELQLLVNCLRAAVDEPVAAKLRDLARREIKWRALLRLADEHKVSSLLYRCLEAHCAGQVPPAILSRLQQQCLETSRRNFFMAGELLRILALLQAHGINGIPYKGPALAMLAYGDLAAREFGDLDIMIRASDHLQARKLLVAQGYQLHLTKAQRLLPWLYDYHDEFTCAGNSARVETHWNFRERFWPFRFAPSGVRAVALAGRQVDSFQPEDLLLILSAHAAKHLWQKLIWISDMAHLIQAHAQMNWERILAQAEAIGCRRILWINLWLAKNLLGTEIPAAILQGMKDDAVAKSLAAQVQKHLLADKPSPWQRPEMLAIYIKMRERWRDRLPLIFFDLNTPSRDDRKNLLVPASLSFLYFLLRPLRLISRTLRNPIGVYRMIKG